VSEKGGMGERQEECYGMWLMVENACVQEHEAWVPCGIRTHRQ
jgi:hypothetical protein